MSGTRFTFPSEDGLSVYSHDITERKLAEEKLLESERRFRLLSETIPQQVWSYLADGTVDYFNQRWLDYTGLTREEAQHSGGHDCVHPDDKRAVETAWHEASARGTPWDVELRLRGRDGQYRRFLSRGVPFYNDSGEILQWFGTNTDIEECKQVEDERSHLLRRLIAAHEDARRLISRELHDEFGQQLSALGLKLGELKKDTAVMEISAANWRLWMRSPNNWIRMLTLSSGNCALPRLMSSAWRLPSRTM